MSHDLEMVEVSRELEKLVPGLHSGMPMIEALKLILAEFKRRIAKESENGEHQKT